MTRKQQTPRLELREAATGLRQTRSYALQIKATGDDGSIEGYGSVFGVLDSYDDSIAPGAFAASLKAHKAAGTMPAMLWQHDADDPIGVWTDMTEDAKGLRVKGQLCLDTACGKEAYALLKMGALKGLSIGFVSTAWEYDSATDIRTLTEVDLWEVSLVTFPANRQSTVTNVKAADTGRIDTIRQAEMVLRDAGLCKDAAKAFVASVKRIALDERDAHEVAAALAAANQVLSSFSS